MFIMIVVGDLSILHGVALFTLACALIKHKIMQA